MPKINPERITNFLAEAQRARLEEYNRVTLWRWQRGSVDKVLITLLENPELAEALARDARAATPSECAA